MKKKDTTALAEAFRKLSSAAAEIANALDSTDKKTDTAEAPVKETAVETTAKPVAKSVKEEAVVPASNVSFEDVRTILAAKAGEHCIFCRIKDTCRERADYYMDLMKHELGDPAELTDDEIALILPKVEGLVGWATDLKEYVLQQALDGRKYKGFKVVEGRATRKYTNEAMVADVVEKAGYDPYEKKVLGITAMTKELGKKKFEELLGGLVYKPKGKPVLVSDDDKRPEYSNVTIDDLNDK